MSKRNAKKPATKSTSRYLDLNTVIWSNGCSDMACEGQTLRYEVWFYESKVEGAVLYRFDRDDWKYVCNVSEIKNEQLRAQLEASL